MKYEYKILIGDPEGKNHLADRVVDWRENDPVTALGCAAFHIHSVIIPIRVCQVFLYVNACTPVTVQTLNVFKPMRFQIFMLVLYAALRSKCLTPLYHQ